MPPLPPRRKRPVQRWLRWLLLALGIVSLSYVGLSLMDARLFQAYENWRLDRALKNAPSVPAGAPAPAAASSSPIEAPAPIGPVASGTVLGRMEISRIGVAVIILEGTGRRTLDRAVGHITGTAFPGQRGNVGIAGHRDTFFRALSNIQQDDEVTLTTLTGSYRYRVDSMKVVGPKDIDVLNDSGEPILTLVTCYPFYFVGPAPKRFIVRAHRI